MTTTVMQSNKKNKLKVLNKWENWLGFCTAVFLVAIKNPPVPSNDGV